MDGRRHPFPYIEKKADLCSRATIESGDDGDSDGESNSI